MCNINVPSNLNSEFYGAIDWLSDLGHVDNNGLCDLSRVLIICWQIWNDRNNKHFRGIKPCHERTRVTALSLSL